MELSLLLAKQIIIQFSMLLVGFLLVRTGIIRSEDGKPLSRIILYVVLPCAILDAFQITYSIHIARNLILAFGSGLLCNLLLVLFSEIAGRFLHFDNIERVSLAYPNSGDLIIPMVSAVLGSEWTVYCCAFMTVQMLLIFTHGKRVLQGAVQLQLRTIFTNIPILATNLGVILFTGQIRLPEIPSTIIARFADALAPLCMLLIGITIGKLNLLSIFKNKRLYLICAIRLLLLPLLILTVLKVSHLSITLPQAKEVLLIVFLACTSSTASTIVQLSQNAGLDAAKASSINVMSVLFLIITMPVMVYLYEHII